MTYKKGTILKYWNDLFLITDDSGQASTGICLTCKEFTTYSLVDHKSPWSFTFQERYEIIATDSALTQLERVVYGIVEDV